MYAGDLRFRAKRIDGEGWAYGYYVHKSDTIAYILKMQNKDRYSQTAVHLRTLGMYTGFQDSKGLRIYDGDILKLTGSYEGTDGSVQPYEEIHKIVYMRGGFYAHSIKGSSHWLLLCEVVDELHDGETYEIVGNIHDEGEDQCSDADAIIAE